MPRSREEVVKFIAEQLAGPEHVGAQQNMTNGGREKGFRWHYGKQELRDLMDFLYGQPPNGPEQNI